MEREKRTYSGPLLEVDYYPILADGRRLPTRAPKTRRSTAEQAKYNALQATKKLTRLVNANFGPEDYILHVTYSPGAIPENEQVARRDMVNYLRRAKTRRVAEAKAARKMAEAMRQSADKLPKNRLIRMAAENKAREAERLAEPLRYIYVMEASEYQRGPNKGRPNIHFHLILSGGLARETMEELWAKGLRVNCARYQPDRFGPEAFAKYISKDPRGSKRFVYSRTLRQPVTKTRDGRVTARAVEQMATKREHDRTYWERRFPGYSFVRCYAALNPYNGRWYVSAVLYRTGGGAPPEWEADEWLTEGL